MTERYFAKVVKVINNETVVINAGKNKNIKEGDIFLIVGLGEPILDPETGNEIERLEKVRGKVSAFHVQDKISTLKACDTIKEPDTVYIEKTTPSKRIPHSISSTISFSSIFPSNDRVSESIKKGDEKIKPLEQPTIGDFALKI